MAKAEAEERALAEAEEKARELAEIEAKAKAEAEEKARIEAEARAEAEEKARFEAEAKAKAKAEAEEKAKKEAEARAETEEKARLEAEAKAKAKAEADEKARVEAEARAKAEEKARIEAEAKANAEERARLEAEARAKAEEAARIEAEARAEAQHRARIEEEEAIAKAKSDAEEKARLEAEEQARLEARALEEAEEKARLEAEARAFREAEEQARLEEEAHALKEAQEQARIEALDRARLEGEAQALKEAEEKARLEEEEAQALKEAEEKASLKAQEQASLEEEAKTKVARKRFPEENGFAESLDFSQEARTAETHPPLDQPSPSANGRMNDLPISPPTRRIHNSRFHDVLLDAELRMVAAGVTIPHADKVLTGGEDAFFVCSSGCGSMGVADGVGSWITDGIDPSLYPKGLMRSVFEYLKSESHDADVLSALEFGHGHTKSPGSATVCLAVVKPAGILEVVNLGNCGLRIIRGAKCVFSTDAMFHEFNMPYQIGNPLILTETDWPCNAETFSIEIQEGDLIIMGTDGLFDNLWNDEITRIANSFYSSSPDVESAKEVAKRIAEVAHFNGKQENLRTPWSVQRAAAGVGPFIKRIFPQGGKMDDCTVLVGIANLCE